MALISQFTCKHCQTEKYELIRNDCLCSDCRTSIDSNRRRMFLENRQKYAIEQRLRMLEEMCFDIDAEKRLKALEARTATY